MRYDYPHFSCVIFCLQLVCMQCVFLYNGLSSFLKEYIFLFYPPLIIIEISITYTYDRTAPKLKQLHVNTRDYIEDAQVINLEKAPCSTFYWKKLTDYSTQLFCHVDIPFKFFDKMQNASDLGQLGAVPSQWHL